MSTTNVNALYDQFLSGGFGSKSEVLPSGTYPKVKIAMVKGKAEQGKKFKLGIRLTVVEGSVNGVDYAGKSTWVNQSLTEPKPGDEKSATAFMMYLKFCVMLGVPEQAIRDRVPAEKLHEMIVTGAEGIAQLGGDRKWQNRAQQDLVSFEVTAVPSPVGGMIAVGSGSAAPTAPVAAPAPVVAPVAVQVPVAAPAPVAAPVTVEQAVAAVAANAPSPDVAALQAQLAALQAAQATPAAAAPVPAGPSF